MISMLMMHGRHTANIVPAAVWRRSKPCPIAPCYRRW